MSRYALLVPFAMLSLFLLGFGPMLGTWWFWPLLLTLPQTLVGFSIVPTARGDSDFRLMIGGESCPIKYSASIYDISAMSFGALGRNAILALNKGAKGGNFAHDNFRRAPSLAMAAFYLPRT